METLETPPHSRDDGLVIAGKSWVHSGKQLGLGDYDQATAKNRTKREKFLADWVAASLVRW